MAPHPAAGLQSAPGAPRLAIMARTGWLGLQLPRFAPRPRSVAVVLSGGGSRASFQIGALRYLYAHDPEFEPTIFAGSSAGAILAAGLSQYTAAEDQRQFLNQVDRIWSNMRQSSDMFTPRPWMARLQAQAPSWLELVTSKPERNRPLLHFMRSTPEPASPSSPISPPDPLELALMPDEDYQPEWSLGVVSQLAGQLGQLPRLGSDLASIRQGLERTRSMYRPGPMLRELLDPEVFDPAKVAAADTQLRVAMVGLESGDLRYMRGDGIIVDRDDNPIDQEQHHLTTGVLASCSIPGVFRAVPLGDETYIDGGAREALPAELAVGRLGPDRTYVIASNTTGLRPRGSMADADIFSVLMRSTEILIDEVARDEVAYAHSAGAVVIQPHLNVHDAMTVRRGLIRINGDYGFSRAAVALKEVEAEEGEIIEEVYSTRLRVYRLERESLANPTDLRTQLRLASAKRDLKEVVGKAPAELLPADAPQWWEDWELHAREVPEEPFWL